MARLYSLRVFNFNRGHCSPIDGVLAYITVGLGVHHLRYKLLLFITAVPNTKLCAWGEEDSGGHVLL